MNRNPFEPQTSPARLGKITASNIYKLMGKGRSHAFTEAGLTYLRQVMAERLTGEAYPSADTFATRWGIDHEDEALDAFATIYYPVESAGFIQYGEHAGATPDAKVLGFPRGVEVKCPYNSANMVEYLQMESAQDLLEVYPEAYWQIQSGLAFTGWERWHFVAYDPRMKDKRHALKTLDIYPTQTVAVLERLALAIDYLEKMKL